MNLANRLWSTFIEVYRPVRLATCWQEQQPEPPVTNPFGDFHTAMREILP